MSYRLITLCGSDSVNPLVPSKPMLHTRFGLTMMKYDFTSPPTKVGVKEKGLHGQKTGKINRKT